MLCDTCRWTERPGFVRRAPLSGSLPQTGADPRSGEGSREALDFVPCPECGGQAIAHCCEGLCEQPEPNSSGADG
jgi:hypothetical protein